MKWWLVSEDTLTEVRFILGLAIKDSGQDESYKSAFRDALHALETGMYHTDTVPADFADPEPEVIRATLVNALHDKANDGNPPTADELIEIATSSFVDVDVQKAMDEMADATDRNDDNPPQ